VIRDERFGRLYGRLIKGRDLGVRAIQGWGLFGMEIGEMFKEYNGIFI